MATRTWTVSGPRAERRGYWQAQVDAYQRSRQSQAAFCAQRGLRKGTFSFWKWKLKQGAGAGAHEPAVTGAPPFIPIRIPAPADRWAAEPPPATPDGVEIELSEDVIAPEQAAVEHDVGDMNPVPQADIARVTGARRAEELHAAPRVVPPRVGVAVVVDDLHEHPAPAFVEVAGARPSKQHGPSG